MNFACGTCSSTSCWGTASPGGKHPCVISAPALRRYALSAPTLSLDATSSYSLYKQPLYSSSSLSFLCAFIFVYSQGLSHSPGKLRKWRICLRRQNEKDVFFFFLLSVLFLRWKRESLCMLFKFIIIAERVVCFSKWDAIQRDSVSVGS
jgi:hypothetical protein